MLRVNPEKKEEKERVTAALLRATLRLAAAHGFTGLGLREVSREADIAPTSFYRHFADMEALGLALIEDLVGPFVRGWIERAPGASKDGGSGVDGIASHALSAAEQDPELMRFILAERAGAIPSFRKALRHELSTIATGLGNAFTVELGAAHPVVPPYVAEAASALLLEACGRALDRDAHSPPTTRARVVEQMRVLLARGAHAGGGS